MAAHRRITCRIPPIDQTLLRLIILPRQICRSRERERASVRARQRVLYGEVSDVLSIPVIALTRAVSKFVARLRSKA